MGLIFNTLTNPTHAFRNINSFDLECLPLFWQGCVSLTSILWELFWIRYPFFPIKSFSVSKLCLTLSRNLSIGLFSKFRNSASHVEMKLLKLSVCTFFLNIKPKVLCKIACRRCACVNSEPVYQKHVSRACISNYIPQTPWDIITNAYPRYLLLTYMFLIVHLCCSVTNSTD